MRLAILLADLNSIIAAYRALSQCHDPNFFDEASQSIADKVNFQVRHSLVLSHNRETSGSTPFRSEAVKVSTCEKPSLVCVR